MLINDTDKDIPLWIVWGWTVVQGEMSILNIALNYRHAKYTYECEKDNPNYLRVWIESTYGNHSFAGRTMYPNLGAIDMMKQDIGNSWQDSYSRMKAICSEIIRAFGNNDRKKFIKLASQFGYEFGLSQQDISDLENKEPNNVTK